MNGFSAFRNILIARILQISLHEIFLFASRNSYGLIHVLV